MSYHREEFVRSRIKALSVLLRSDNTTQDDDNDYNTPTISEHTIDRLIRMLRPTNHQIQEYAKPVKIRLRQSILNHPHINTALGTTSNEGPLLLARFDKEVETLTRMNSALIHSLLIFLKPLSFYEPPKRQVVRHKSNGAHIQQYGTAGTHTPATALHSRNIVSNEEKLQQQVYTKSSQVELLSQRNSLNKGLHEERSSSSSSTGNTVRISITQQPAATSNSTKQTNAAPSATAVDTSMNPNAALTPQQISMHWVTPEVERKLLIDLVYVLQGVTGKYIKYDSRSESYVIDPALQVPGTVRDLTLCICELGWLYNKVNDYLKRVFQTGNTSTTTPSSSSSMVITESKGLVVQAFGFALQEELHDYYRLLAILEQELMKDNNATLSTSSQMTVGVRESDREFQSKQTQSDVQYNNSHHSDNHGNGNGNAGLTLLRLRAWMQEPIDRMCLMARLVDGAGLLTGGALASRLHAHARHGDMSCSELVQRIMDSVCNPIYTMLTRWILHGELHDPHGEFFVGTMTTIGAAQGSGLGQGQGQQAMQAMKNIWKESYVLRSNLLPTFIPRPLAEKMVVIGKSINFIKLCLQRLPKAKRSLSTSTTTGTTSGTGVRRSLRQINKAKKLTTYGRVIDTDNLESKESITEDAEDMMDVVGEDESEMQQQGEDGSGGRISGEVGGPNGPAAAQAAKAMKAHNKNANKDNKDSSTSKELLNTNLNKEVESILQEIFSTTTRGSHNRRGGGGGEREEEDVEVTLKKLLRTTSLVNTQDYHHQTQQQQEQQDDDDKRRVSIHHNNTSFELSEVIYKLSNAIDNSLLQLLYNSFSFMKHLQALKKFMLLGQGDFVTCLMDSIGPELKKRANQLFRHNLTSILEGALRSSNAQYEDSFILDRVGVRLLEPVPGDSGWEIFSLDYQVDLPLNAVVNNEAMSKYRIAFHMLWRLKRVEWSLASTWKQFLTFAHCFDRPVVGGGKGSSSSSTAGVNLTGLVDLKAVFHRCHLNRARMMHVINNLCAYLMFEVLETAWLHLEQALKKSTCLDDVIAAHDAYLNEILDRALLSTHHEVLNIQLQQLLQIILRFCHLEETLIADATAYIARQRLAVSAYQERNKYGDNFDDNASVNSQATSNTVRGGTSRYVPPSEGLPLMVIGRIDETVKEYSAQFDKLMDMLKDESDKSGEFLRFLTFRLDFNDYHEKQRQRGRGVGITGTPKATGTAPPLPLAYGAELDDGDDMTANFQPRKLNL